MSGSGAEGVSGIMVHGTEQYGLEDPRAEMDLVRHEIDISIDQKLKGVEKRLQVSTALAALKPQLLADLDTRFQGFDSRLQVCTSLSVCPECCAMSCYATLRDSHCHFPPDDLPTTVKKLITLLHQLLP